MAIDTRDKRANCLSVCRTSTVVAPNPDGTIASQSDRQHNAFTYRGILASSVSQINTRDKRANCLAIARSFMTLAPNPDGSIASQADRQHNAFTYRGILVGSVATDLIWTVSFDSASQETVGNLSVTCTSADLVVSVL